RPEIAWHRVKQIVGRVRVAWLGQLLSAVTGPGEIPVAEARKQLVSPYRRHRGQSHGELARAMPCGPEYRARREPGLEHRLERPSPVRQARSRPVELRRVERGELHHRHADGALLVPQLRLQRIVETLQRMLGRAIRRLERYPAISERRTDEDHA